ncbi:hypothetical protein [Chryseobacterium indologenes]|uniref:hypothetical protein n=1 Tax=Chryseobacterium indologenes TaxID=253 RepID=UPI0009A1B173|nr:hypothetical protein [Chryseobacterium indologenes]
MDILKISTEWALAELFSAKIVGLFSIIGLCSAAGFAIWGTSVTAKAFVIPMIIAGSFLATVGIGLYVANKPRLEQFKNDYNTDSKNFVKKEIARTSKSQADFKTVFKILPLIIIAATILFLFSTSANWKAITITVMITSCFLMIVDINTEARNKAYHEKLLTFTML